MAPHSVDSEFLSLIDKYRGIVEEALCDRLGRPSFFFVAVEVVMGRIQEKIQAEEKAWATGAPQESGEQGNSNGKRMRFALREDRIRELAQEEAKRPGDGAGVIDNLP